MSPFTHILESVRKRPKHQLCQQSFQAQSPISYILSGPKPLPRKATCPLAWAVSRSLVLNLEAKAKATFLASLLLHCCLTARKLRPWLISIRCFTYVSPLLEAPYSTPLSFLFFLFSCFLFYYTEDKIYCKDLSICSCFSHHYLCMYSGCVCLSVCVCAPTHVHTRTHPHLYKSQHAYGGQRTSCQSQFSPSVLWDPDTELKWSGLVAITLTC